MPLPPILGEGRSSFNYMGTLPEFLGVVSHHPMIWVRYLKFLALLSRRLTFVKCRVRLSFGEAKSSLEYTGTAHTFPQLWMRRTRQGTRYHLRL